MSGIKLLHLADLHLGRKVSHLSKEKRQMRISELILSFSDILMGFNDADVVLISGDLFDGDCEQSLIEYICKNFAVHSEKQFFISCGNHDPLNSASIQKLIELKPSNVHLFGDSVECIKIDELSLRIYGVSFSANNSYASLISGFSAPTDEYLNIMVLHADVGADSQYNPISYEDIEHSNLNYLALGHVHNFSGIKKRKDTYYSYPGVPEPCGFDETGECGVIYGYISKDDCDLDFYPVSKRKYISIEFDLSNLNSNEELISELKTLVDDTNFYKINLVGRKKFSLHLNMYEQLLGCFYVEFADSTVNADDILNYTNELSLRGKTANHLLTLKGVEDEETFSLVREYLTELLCRE